MPPLFRTQVFSLLQNSCWWLCMPPTFLALYFGDLFHTGVGMAMLVSKTMCLLLTRTCSRTLQETAEFPAAGNLPVSVLIRSFTVSQAFTVHGFSLTCSFTTFSHFRSTLIQKVPRRCLSWSRRDWSTQTPIPICYLSSSTACRCHVSTSQFSRATGTEEPGEALV